MIQYFEIYDLKIYGFGSFLKIDKDTSIKLVDT